MLKFGSITPELPLNEFTQRHDPEFIGFIDRSQRCAQCIFANVVVNQKYSAPAGMVVEIANEEGQIMTLLQIRVPGAAMPEHVEPAPAVKCQLVLRNGIAARGASGDVRQPAWRTYEKERKGPGASYVPETMEQVPVPPFEFSPMIADAANALAPIRGDSEDRLVQLIEILGRMGHERKFDHDMSEDILPLDVLTMVPSMRSQADVVVVRM